MSQGAKRTKNDMSDLRVLLVDDHDLFRTGLRNLLEEQGVQIVGEAANGHDAIRCVREVAPDIVVMDLNMPGMTGVEATREITSFAPLTRVLVLTISEQDEDPVPGMGVRFHGLDVGELLLLNEYFASLTATLDHDEAV